MESRIVLKMDAKDTIIEALDTMRKKDVAEKRHFQAIAYKKAIAQLKALNKPITSIEDVKGLPGVGDKIQKKIAEILATGKLAAAEQAKAAVPLALYDDLLNVYGIGPAKARNLVEKTKITSIEDLRKRVLEDPKLLNEVQKLGLKYYEDIKLRIPREEMEQHEAMILGNLDKQFKAVIVGSYRRGAASSGDIDVLLMLPDSVSESERNKLFKATIAGYEAKGYIKAILAKGDKKCLAVSQLEGKPARRLDLLMTPEAEFAYAILYFTGSDVFNVAFRSYALSKGYTLNEHTMKPTGDAPVPPPMKYEKDIFDFLGLEYVEPSLRRGEADVKAKVEEAKPVAAAPVKKYKPRVVAKLGSKARKTRRRSGSSTKD
jgi:DNA polymerase/3'-5' exonuclease PolX